MTFACSSTRRDIGPDGGCLLGGRGQCANAAGLWQLASAISIILMTYGGLTRQYIPVRNLKLLTLGSKAPHHFNATVQISQKQCRSRHRIQVAWSAVLRRHLLSRSEEPMFKSKGNLIWLVAGLVPFVLATSGCATRRYARNQVKPVAEHVDALETQTNEKIAAVSTKHESDISQVNERISSTDLRVTQVANAVQEAQGTASRAMELAESKANRSDTDIAVISPVAPTQLPTGRQG